MNHPSGQQPLSTADLAAAARHAPRPLDDGHEVHDEHDDVHEDAHHDHGDRHAMRQPAAEELAALFAPEAAQEFRSRWDEIQIGFVDDPGQAVRRADELVAQVMQNLAETFARERSELEQYLGGPEAQASTENLRVALRRYRSFFQRLLSL
jgi:5'-deoxynucleotidase YfbR-like HD superfamily hydrolase